MIGMIISACLSALIQLMWVPTAISMQYFYFCLLASVYTICPSMTYYNLMIIFRHHVKGLIYGNCFVCMLNNTWYVQLIFWKINLSSFSFSNFINMSTMIFSLTLHLFVVFYRVDGLYKMIRGETWGEWEYILRAAFEVQRLPTEVVTK